MTDTRTISQLEAEGYPWIGCECCKGTVWVPFEMIRETIPALSAWTLDELGGQDEMRQVRQAPIGATPQIASASHIVVTFNFRFGAHYGLNSDIAHVRKPSQEGKSPLHSTTKSALPSSVAGNSMPSDFAVLRLRASS